MKTPANCKHLLAAMFVFIFSVNAYSQIFSGVLICPKDPNHTIRAASLTQAQQAMRRHLCTSHGIYCPTTSTYYNPQPPAKSKEQIRAEMEQKELREAAETANDEGVEYYEKKDWATAINYFKAALEYVPDFEDAIYNLKKAEEKLVAERQRFEEEERQRKLKEEEEIQKQLADSVQTVNLPPALNKYMEEADKIIVPPPSWESNIEEQVRLIRLGQQNDNSGLLFYKNIMIAAFEQEVKLNKGQELLFRILMICDKATNASLDEANIVAFRQNAWYERTLLILKDPKRGPLLIAAIKALREKKPMPAGVTPEIEKMAKATQDPKLGNSSVQMSMDALLSKESKAAFFQTFKMEALGLISDEIKGVVDGADDALKGEAWKFVEDRIDGLKKINSVIGGLKNFMSPFDKGAKLVNKDHQPIIDSIIQNKISDLEKNIHSFKPIPGAITNAMSFFDRDKTTGN